MLPRIALLAAALFVLACSFGLASGQEGDAQLRDTIRGAILMDPRSHSMTPEELESLVAALTREAEADGLTSDDVLWRPTGEAVGSAQVPPCDNFLCQLNRAFGFDGSDYTIPIWLAACSLALIFIFAAHRKMARLHARASQAASVMPQMSSPPQQPIEPGMGQ